jgi:hypothetical protein
VLKSLANSQCLKNLTDLNLAYCNNITDLGVSLIFNSELCRNIRKIDLSETNLKDASLISLAGSMHLSNLTELSLYGCEAFTLEGLEYIFESEKLRNSLAILDLRLKLDPSLGDLILGNLTSRLYLFSSLKNVSLCFSGYIFKELSFAKAWGNIEKLRDLFTLVIEFSG